MYRSALDRLRKRLDDRGREIWIERMGPTGKADVFYRYDSNGRLMRFTRKIFGFVIDEAEYVRFGEDVCLRDEG